MYQTIQVKPVPVDIVRLITSISRNNTQAGGYGPSWLFLYQLMSNPFHYTDQDSSYTSKYARSTQQTGFHIYNEPDHYADPPAFCPCTQLVINEMQDIFPIPKINC
jgi:hypothetical protein